MNLRSVLRRSLGVQVAAVVVIGLGLPGAASASTAQVAGSPNTCALQTINTLNYVTAVDGGGRTTDVIRTNETQVRSWEKLTFVITADRNPTRYGIKTSGGFYLTAVGGGGRDTDVIHSNATQLQAWEKFNIVVLEGNVVALQTITGNYLTAVGGGGRTSDVIHSNATVIGTWERFFLTCGF